MTKVSYETAYKDHKYLWCKIGPAADMTGAYVDSEDLTKLLKTPTKATAKDCLISQIQYWFQTGTEEYTRSEISDMITKDSQLLEIYERYCE